MSRTMDQARIEALVADLRKVLPFADQSQDDLEWFVSQSEERRTPVGEITVKEGAPADTMFVILEGELRARRENGPADGPVYSAGAGDVTGVLPFSRMKNFFVTVRAVLPMRTLAFPASKFAELFQRMPELSQRLVEARKLQRRVRPCGPRGGHPELAGKPRCRGSLEARSAPRRFESDERTSRNLCECCGNIAWTRIDPFRHAPRNGAHCFRAGKQHRAHFRSD